ncbi:MAG: hypothetical protein AAFP69_03195, partial [Planctomycetota bacterium]
EQDEEYLDEQQRQEMLSSCSPSKSTSRSSSAERGLFAAYDARRPAGFNSASASCWSRHRGGLADPMWPPPAADESGDNRGGNAGDGSIDGG